MAYRIKFTRVSGNSKTGPLPTTITSSDSCPTACPLQGNNGCYASYGMVGLHWRKTDKGEHVTDWQGLCDNIKALLKGQLWRMNVAGDLPHNNQLIDGVALQKLVTANKSKQGFTYTHHNMHLPHNRAVIETANSQGFTINLSANNLQHADELKALNIGPVVTIVPADYPKTGITPDGHAVVTCPATYREDVTCATCATCGICAVTTRRAIIAFPVHGSGKKKAHKVEDYEYLEKYPDSKITTETNVGACHMAWDNYEGRSCDWRYCIKEVIPAEPVENPVEKLYTVKQVLDAMREYNGYTSPVSTTTLEGVQRLLDLKADPEYSTYLRLKEKFKE